MLHIRSLENDSHVKKNMYLDRLSFHKVKWSDVTNVLDATLKILSSINFVLLTMLKVREEQIHFWFCWCFPPTGPMYLISALSLWAGTLQAKHGGVLQLPDSTKWRTRIYEHKHTGDTGHSGNHCPQMLEDVNYINNNNNYYYNHPQQNQGWNQQRPNYSEWWSRTPRHPDLHRHGGLPRSTLRL